MNNHKGKQVEHIIIGIVYMMLLCLVLPLIPKWDYDWLLMFGGFISSFLCLGIALIYFVFKLCNWNSFQPGIAPIIIGVFLMDRYNCFL